MEEVRVLLKQKNWGFEEIDQETITTGFQIDLDSGEVLGFPLYFLRISDPFENPYTRLVIVPYIKKITESFNPKFLERIARINHDLTQLKLALDDDGDLELLLDVPQAQVSVESLDQALQFLIDCAIAFYAQLVKSAVDEEKHEHTPQDD